MRFTLGFALFALGTVVGGGIQREIDKNSRAAAPVARTDCAALEPRIAKLEATALPACIQVERWQLDIYPAPILKTQPRVTKQ